MSLLSQVAGALAAGALIFVLARQAGVRGKQAVGAVALVPIAVAALLAVPSLRDAAASLLDQREVNAGLTVDQAQVQGGVAVGVDVAFVGWAGGHLAEGEDFHLIVGDGDSDVDPTAVVQWTLFQLAPHLEAVEPDQADWLIFYNSEPALYRPSELRKLDVNSPGFAVARNRYAR